MGWDDNGLNIERRTQINYGVICDPSLPYDAELRAAGQAAEGPDARFAAELRGAVLASDRRARGGVPAGSGAPSGCRSTGATSTARSAPTSPACRNSRSCACVERGEAFRLEAPTLWDVDFKTSLAQADLEDREMAGAYHRIKFSDIEIDTTRPELIPACVALVAHPDDERYKPRFGTTVRSPLFNVEVPVLAHELADPEKGTGIAMICTFGDQTDVMWWRELDLPVRSVMGRDGRLVPIELGRPGSPGALRRAGGQDAKQAQKRIVEMLHESGDLVGDPKPITHAVKFWENGKRPLEIVTTRQWFIKFPTKEVLLDRGTRAEVPSRVHAGAAARTGSRAFTATGTSRASASSACRSRSGIRSATTARSTGTRRSRADVDALPVDPSTDTPPGYTEAQRNQPGGFVGDPDVMDTWATSSMSPEFVSGWRARPRPVRARLPDGPAAARRTTSSGPGSSTHSCAPRCEFGSLPFTNAAISGLRRGPGPQEDVEVEEQRRRRSVRAHGQARRRRASATGPPGRGPAATVSSIRTSSRSAGGWRRRC